MGGFFDGKAAGLIVTLGLCLDVTPALSQTQDTFSVAVKPLRDATGAVVALEVHEQFDDSLFSEAPLSLKAALSATGVAHIADSIADLTIQDAQGTVPVATRDDPPNTGFESAYRHWQTKRPVRFPIEVRYRIPVQPPSDRGAPVGMKPAGQGVAGGGIGFLLLPETNDALISRMSWDLSEMPGGSIGVVSSGEGTVEIKGPPVEMVKQWFLAGPAMVIRAAPPSGFQGYLIGTPPFDGRGILDWAARSYTVLGNWFRYLGSPPYRFFIRAGNGVSYGTGVANDGRGSSLIDVGDVPWPGQDSIDIYTTAFHEMTHQWVGLITGRHSWFEEGLTVYVSTILPCRTGLLSPSDCVKQFNNAIESYLTSPGRDWSQAKIDTSPFTDERIRTVPYGRGALYFANLDAQLSTRSHGQRSLQDVLIPLLAARETGRGLDQMDWETMLQKELGSIAVTEFRQAMVEGTRRITPPSNALGPCWRRVATIYKLKTGEEAPGFAWQPLAHLPGSCKNMLQIDNRPRGSQRPKASAGPRDNG